MLRQMRLWLLLLSVFLVIASGIIYELLIAAYSAYLQGDSIYQFSLTIGLFMSAMGVGSYLSGKVEKQIESFLITIELSLALIGTFSIFLLGVIDLYTPIYTPSSHLLTFILGVLTGFPVPLVIRLSETKLPTKNLLANVLFIDYIGALAGSLILPLWLLPHFGFDKSAIFAATLSFIGALFATFLLYEELIPFKKISFFIFVVSFALFFSWNFNESLLKKLKHRKNPQLQEVFLHHSLYQELRFVRYKKSYYLSLNGQPQFSTQDERRYHESLIHPAMSLASSRRRILLLGGGDGLALREVWKYHDVEKVIMVDLDPAMTQFGQQNAVIRRLNRHSMKPLKRHRHYCVYRWLCSGRAPRLLWSLPRKAAKADCPSYSHSLPSEPDCHLSIEKKSQEQQLIIKNRDAWKFIEESRERFPVIISDLPDATNIALSKLYSVEFYRMLKKHLAPQGMLTVQSTSVSPFFRRGYWCIVNTIRAAGFRAKGYHVWVPSYGLHTTFTLAAHESIDLTQLHLKVPTLFLNDDFLPALFWFPKDIAEIPTPINRIDTHILLKLLLHG